MGDAFSPDGKTLMTGSFATMRFWEAATGKQLGPPLLHQGRVYAASFSPDGKSALTGCHEAMAGPFDGMARLWRLPQVRGNPEQIVLWTQVITGLELDEHGLVRVLDAATWQQRRDRLEKLGGPPCLDDTEA